MKLFLLLILIGCICHAALGQSAAVFQWNEAPNRLQNSSFGFNLNGVLQACNPPSNTCYLAAESFPLNMISHCSVSQVSTNPAGVSATTPCSGEVLVARSEQIIVSGQMTNVLINYSADLGKTWQVAGTNAIVVPMTNAKAFYRASAIFLTALTKTNKLDFPPMPGN